MARTFEGSGGRFVGIDECIAKTEAYVVVNFVFDGKSGVEAIEGAEVVVETKFLLK